MDSKESLREVSRLRLRFQMNNRLRLECLAALSKVFREYAEPVSDELLSSLILALPNELHSKEDAEVPPTAIPPTAIPPTAIPPTAIPPTAIPPTAVPPTAIPPTGVPPTTAVPPPGKKGR